MKKIVLFLLLILVSNVFAQKVVTGVSESKYVNITKEPPKPPFLEVVDGSLVFTDRNGNMKIDAGEIAYIRFELFNSGIGSGVNLIARTNIDNRIQGLSFSEAIPLGTLESGSVKAVDIPLHGGLDLMEGMADFQIVIDEANGFDSNPIKISVQTCPFRSPLLKIVDYQVSSQTGSTLEKRKPFDLQVLVQNTGQGIATTIRINVTLPANIFCLTSNESVEISEMEPGATRLLKYSFVTTAEYLDDMISFTFSLSEKYGKYAEGKIITLDMSQSVTGDTLVVKGQQETFNDITPASLSSSVDKNIPVNENKNPLRLALVIGNENYSRTGYINSQINVDFARNDASIFREYCLNTLGILKENMFFLTDASAGEMRKEIDRVTEILKRLGSQSELIFYFAGHGFPDEITHVPYLMPIDIDATNLAYAIKLSEFYQKLSATGAKRITIFLDACFSGGGRNQGLISSRHVRVVPKENLPLGNTVVFAASSGDQSSLPYRNEKHGMFTYFLLKKLQDTRGELTYGELSDYLRVKVGIVSLQENGKMQDPEVLTSPQLGNDWKIWKIK